MKNTILYTIITIIIVAVVGVLVYEYYDAQSPKKVTDYESCVAAGYPILESYPPQCQTPEGETFTKDVSTDITDRVTVSTPQANTEVRTPVRITGEAPGNWYFEADFPIDVVTNTGETLATGIAQAQAPWMTEELVPFEALIYFPPSAATTGEIQLKRANPSGLDENDATVSIPVSFPKADTQTVSVYFPAPGGTTCAADEAFEREIYQTESIARTTLETLLAGPTDEERSAGYSSSIPSGVSINSISIEDGTASVDFSEELSAYGGGSCMVEAIQTQIRNTLTQFATIDTVMISIEGETEEILQP